MVLGGGFGRVFVGHIGQDQPSRLEAWDAVAEVVPMGRATEPSEIAPVILFPASDLSSHMPGQTLVIDGAPTGHLAPPKLW